MAEQQSYNQRNQVQIDLEEYEAKNAEIGALKDEIQKMKDAAGPNKIGWLWLAPEYFSRFFDDIDVRLDEDVGGRVRTSPHVT